MATGSLLAVWWRIPSLGMGLPLSGPGCHPPASLPPAGDGPVSCWLAVLWYSLSPLSVAAWQNIRLGLFVGKFSLSSLSLSLSLSLWLSHSSGCYLTLAPSYCPQGIQSRSFSSVQFSHSVVSSPLRLYESEHARPPSLSPTPRVHSNSWPSSQ